MSVIESEAAGSDMERRKQRRGRRDACPGRAADILEIGMGWFREEPGGLNRMYAGLIRALAARHVRIRGVVAGDPALAGPVPEGLSFFARRSASWPLRLAACRRAVNKALKHGSIDLVAAHFAPYALPSLDLVRDRPFVFHFHGPWADESQFEQQHGVAVSLKKKIESLVYGRAVRFIVLSRAFGSVLEERYRVDPDLVHVVPGGVDVTRFETRLSRRDARLTLGLPTDRPIVCVIRRLVRRVGLEELVEAMRLVRARLPDALLLIAGKGPLAGRLAAVVADRGLEHHVRFMGFVDDERLPLLYRASEVSIVPSAALEGFGLTTIESLAAGTPVLVTPVGGLPEAVAPLSANLVLNGAGRAAIACGVIDALSGDMSLPSPEGCTRYARANFDWPMVADRVLAVYG